MTLCFIYILSKADCVVSREDSSLPLFCHLKSWMKCARAKRIVSVHLDLGGRALLK